MLLVNNAGWTVLLEVRSVRGLWVGVLLLEKRPQSIGTDAPAIQGKEVSAKRESQVGIHGLIAPGAWKQWPSLEDMPVCDVFSVTGMKGCANVGGVKTEPVRAASNVRWYKRGTGDEVPDHSKTREVPG